MERSLGIAEARKDERSRVLALLDAKIAKIEIQRTKEDYSTLSPPHKDCPEGCGDEGLFHQGQILRELRNSIGGLEGERPSSELRAEIEKEVG